MFRVSCVCGNETAVKPSSAGAVIRCRRCQRQLTVPPLSQLRSSAQRDEATPAIGQQLASVFRADDDSVAASPSVAHFSGDVGATGSVSRWAMENFVAVILSKIDGLMSQRDPSQQIQYLISCALLPNQEKWVQVKTLSEDGESDLVNQLEQLVHDTASPSVEGGPVAFVIYRQQKSLGVSRDQLRPFSDLHEQIEKWGADAAFMRAGGLPWPPAGSARSGPTLWQRFVGIFRSKVKPADREPSPREVHQEMTAWLEQAERTYADWSASRLRKSARRQPLDISYHLGMALKHAESDQWSKAAEDYSAAITVAPDFAGLYGRRGHAYQVSGNSQQALADFNQAIALAPFEPRYYSQRAQIFAGLGAWPQAQQDLISARELAPRDPALLLFLAAIHMEQNQYDRALEDLSEAISLDPHCGQAHAQLGWIYQETEHYDVILATEHLTRAVELMPETAASRIRRSLAYAAQNKFALSLEDCDTVIRSHPESPAAHGVRGRVLQMQGEFEEAIASCSRAIELGLDTAMVFLSRGICYAATDQPLLAASDCEAALALEPENPLACHLRGTLCMQQGDFDAAMESFNKARRLAPQWNEPREHLALLHRIKENPQAAVDEHSTLIEQQPNGSSHYVNRALAYAQLGDFESAEQDYDQAIELEPENEHVFYWRGVYFLQRQDYESALSDFDRVLAIDGDYDDARLHRASVLLQLKRQAEALEDYAKLINKYPDDPNAYTGRAYALQLIGKEQAAEEDLERLMDIVPEQSVQMNVSALSAKIRRLRDQAEYESAIELAEEIITLVPEDPIGYRLRGGIYWDLEWLVEAYDDYTRVLEIVPEQPEVLSARGQVQAEMGEWRPALDDLDIAADLSRKAGANLTLAFTLSGKSLAFAGLDRIDESNRVFEESVKLCPTNPWVYYHRGLIMFRRGVYSEAQRWLQRSLELEEPALSARKKKRALSLVEQAAALSENRSREKE